MRKDDNFADIVRINGHLLACVICGVGAYLIWPTSIEWWGFGFLSIVLGICAFKSLVRAFRLMRKLKRFADYEADRAKPKSATLASAEALRKAGMK